jgi:hypothetical protein
VLSSLHFLFPPPHLDLIIHSCQHFSPFLLEAADMIVMVDTVVVVALIDDILEGDW